MVLSLSPSTGHASGESWKLQSAKSKVFVWIPKLPSHCTPFLMLDTGKMQARIRTKGRGTVKEEHQVHVQGLGINILLYKIILNRNSLPSVHSVCVCGWEREGGRETAYLCMYILSFQGWYIFINTRMCGLPAAKAFLLFLGRIWLGTAFCQCFSFIKYLRPALFTSSSTYFFSRLCQLFELGFSAYCTWLNMALSHQKYSSPLWIRLVGCFDLT